MKYPAWIKKGALAMYSPIGIDGPWYRCIIDSEPYLLGCNTVVVKIDCVENYAKKRICGVFVKHLKQRLE